MSVQKYRSVADMPPPWTAPDDPDNLRRVAQMLALYYRLKARPTPGVRRFRTIEEANADRDDAYRREA